MEKVIDLQKYCDAVVSITEELKTGIKKTEIFCGEKNISIEYNLDILLKEKVFGVTFIFTSEEDLNKMIDSISSYFVSQYNFNCVVLKNSILYSKCLKNG